MNSPDKNSVAYKSVRVQIPSRKRYHLISKETIKNMKTLTIALVLLASLLVGCPKPASVVSTDIGSDIPVGPVTSSDVADASVDH